MLILLHHRATASRAALVLASVLGLLGLARWDAPAGVRILLALACIRPWLRPSARRPAPCVLDLGPSGVLFTAQHGLRVAARRARWGRLHPGGSHFALRGGWPTAGWRLPPSSAARRELSALGRHLHQHADGRPAAWWPVFTPLRRRGGGRLWL